MTAVRSLFVTGTDTSVGKTVISAGLSRAISDRGIDVGVMKPFASGRARASGFRSHDVRVLAEAARVSDPEEMINPQFFPLDASPYTASRLTGVRPDVKTVLDRFDRLKKSHDMVVVEGIGGIMTPIRRDYSVADLIQDMDLPAVIVATNRIGTINHTVLTENTCRDYYISAIGIVLNRIDPDGYDTDQLGGELEDLTGLDVLGTIPYMGSADPARAADVLEQNMDLSGLLRSLGAAARSRGKEPGLRP